MSSFHILHSSNPSLSPTYLSKAMQAQPTITIHHDFLDPLYFFIHVRRYITRYWAERPNGNGNRTTSDEMFRF